MASTSSRPAPADLRFVVFPIYAPMAGPLPPIGHRYLRCVSRNYKIYDQEDLHYLTYATVGWVDVFTRPTYKDILVESLPGLPGMLRLETIWAEVIAGPVPPMRD